MITVQAREVYRSESRGRAFLTLPGALRAECFAQIRDKRCYCSPAEDEFDQAETCLYHDFPEDGQASHGILVANRFARFYGYRIRRALDVLSRYSAADTGDADPGEDASAAAGWIGP